MRSKLNSLVEAITAAGGKCFLIGGAVIDSILNLDIKDWDIEVYGLPFNTIEGVLKVQSLPVNMVGASFGVIKTVVNGLDVDISVPRRENKIGISHKEFSVDFDPTMTPKEAGRRRDLTINSMYLDLSTGEIVDPFGGIADLKAGILRATNPDTFIEDSLRVLRIMQILPRKGKVVDSGTVGLCASIVDEYKHLPKERVFGEFNKLLLKAERPSKGLDFLAACGWIKHFPELRRLIGCLQHPEWHPEGDVFEHTKGVLNAAAQLKQFVPEDWKLAFMYGALLHDVGKSLTTKEDFTSHGHDEAGVPLAETFMRRLTNDVVLIERVVSIVKNHMRVGQLFTGESKVSSWKRLHNTLRLDICAYISKADSLSRYGHDVLRDKHKPSERALELFESFGIDPIKPILMGRHLIERGLKPGKNFGKILSEAYEIQIEEDILEVEVLFNRVVKE